jgi:hypothetical protein
MPFENNQEFIKRRQFKPVSVRKALESAATDAVIPDDTWLKADIQAWLTNAGIAYPSDATKAELLALARAN